MNPLKEKMKKIKQKDVYVANNKENEGNRIDKNSNKSFDKKTECIENIKRNIISLDKTNKLKVSLESSSNLFTFNNDMSNTESEYIYSNVGDSAHGKVRPIGLPFGNKFKNSSNLTKKLEGMNDSFLKMNSLEVSSPIKTFQIINDNNEFNKVQGLNIQLENLREENRELLTKLRNLNQENHQIKSSYEKFEKEISDCRRNENEMRRLLKDSENEVTLYIKFE